MPKPSQNLKKQSVAITASAECPMESPEAIEQTTISTRVIP
uniref:Uncharacterized protein n=1 Tax=Rhizophora mucronata TaxID=61149 RepID=A0A2P2QV22_RHIMU